MGGGRGYLGLDDDLDRSAAVHLVERGLVVFELEDVRDHALDVDLAAVEVRDGAREAVRLRERADDLQTRQSAPTFRDFVTSRKRTLISSPKILDGGQWICALFSYTP